LTETMMAGIINQN